MKQGFGLVIAPVDPRLGESNGDVVAGKRVAQGTLAIVTYALPTITCRKDGRLHNLLK
jgi:hypothetical protein